MTTDPLRAPIHAHHTAREAEVLDRLLAHAPTAALRQAATARATRLVEAIRNDGRPGLMEVFLAEYGLSTREGIALMCLAEALLRVPDADTIDALIEDKIAPSDWGVHLGKSSSSLVNASTWALLLTGRVLQDGEGLASVLKGAVRRLGEPVIRTAVGRAMKEMGRQFVLGETIDEALRRGREKAARGYTFSYDMLGEAALTAHDADAFDRAYAAAIARLAATCASSDIRDNPGISIKLSALHPRYEEAQRARVMDELVPCVLALARQAAAAGMGLNIDAEEADRLDLSLDVIEAVLADPTLQGWDGFGVVVQAYGKRALPVIEWLHALAARLDRRIMVRLVKGAYWDSEIKRAQVEGLDDFPVFTRKAATDVSYLCCAARLLALSDRIYPQFATHNAHSVAAILEMAADPRTFEFQRLHGMGEVLHDQVLAANATRCRIYAPVGAHRDLLAYLVRRLLENGANSSFVNQIVDASVPAATVAADPFDVLAKAGPNRAVVSPADLFGAERRNSRGVDLRDRVTVGRLDAARRPWRAHVWEAGPITVDGAKGGGVIEVRNPADPSDLVGRLREATVQDAARAVAAARPWDEVDTAERARVLGRAADLYEAAHGEVFAVLAREAGKVPADAVSELREAVDFLRYYAARAAQLDAPARGRVTCISPWNFPLAIFTGQIAAALAAGNAVLAKPAEATSITAAIAVRLLHEAGVPRHALQLLPGRGAVIGTALTTDAMVDGVCFTGSTVTAQRINRSMAASMAPTAPLIAETGGLNAMIVDSTALPEQAVRDIVTSAFRSAGQRCSALRMLYLQEDVAQPFLKMLYGAMDELSLGDPWDLSTDIGPVISAEARAGIEAHVAQAAREGRVLKRLATPRQGTFVAPTVIRLSGIGALEREVFGPVLHVATFRSDELDAVVAAINARGYGLTFALHSRIDDRVEQVAARVRAGNIYINRNQIGAVVGSQPFGGEGLSGTGPKAGGPAYLHRFVRPPAAAAAVPSGQPVSAEALQRAIAALAGQGDRVTGTKNLPGPTGESNRLTTLGRGVVLCLGPGADRARAQALEVRAAGAAALAIAPGLEGGEGLDGTLDPAMLATLSGFDAVVCEAPDEALRPLRRALADRDGAILPLLAEADFARWVVIERHLCIDTTASGGNAALLASAG
ncbi:bifunctional proline dehydrogenase/L-glutamate gamma-semialdehyde dehydrogenase PutA [Palleronia sp. KMU-117]|uniref:bifunctional proline dehydrogenase/L-glutamate gamma-semialdehyde dehydrogenase PutA n=1 Tax=Palleronia sp. KMU-117 TaxID=3434108 RepID=UPI003D725C59